ncbi:MAG: methylmalonyl-CoA mutase family protein, partial [Ilumatobacteraceae bacterium]
ETNVAHVADPLGGSHFVEALTDEVERQAEEIFAHLESLGGGSMLEGAIRGIEENWFQGRIADSAYELERKLNNGSRITVGVNAFTEGNEEEQIPLLRITNEDEKRQRKRLETVRAGRAGDRVAAILERLRTEAADPEINLMPTLIDAATAYATLGEIMGAMGTVFGRHVEVPTI